MGGSGNTLEYIYPVPFIEEPKRKYNFIYTQLVENDNDLVGHVAYSIYKSKKVAFITKHKAANNNNDPTEKELDGFHLASLQHLDSYKLEAQQILHQYNTITLQDRLEKIDQETEKKIKKIKQNSQNELDNKLKSLKPNHGAGIIDSILGAVFFSILIGVLFLFIFGMKYGTDGLVTLIKNVIVEASHVSGDAVDDAKNHSSPESAPPSTPPPDQSSEPPPQPTPETAS